MIATIIFFAIFFTLWCLFHFVIKPKLKFIKIINKLPGAPTYPILGNAYIFLGIPREDIFTKILEYNKKYGSLCRNWIGLTPIVHISKPDHTELILQSSENITKGKVYDALRAWLGQGILLATGEKWYKRRKLLTPAFHSKILENYIEIFAEKSESIVDKLEKHADGKIFDIYPILTDCTLGIISETAMNVKINSVNNLNHLKYVNAVSTLCELVVLQGVKPWLKILFLPFFSYGKEMERCRLFIHNFTNKIIERRKSILTSKLWKIEQHFGKKHQLSFLDILLTSKHAGLTDKEIREEVDTIMVAGHHTIAASISWTLLLLGNNADVQEKLYEELKSVLQNRKTPSSIDDLDKLKYLECVVNESLRLYPSIPIVTRKLSEDIYLDGYQIPKNCQVALQIFDIHRDPEFWDDPNDFDPTRFYPLNSISRHPYSYIPFSEGPRNCLGQKFAMYEEKTVLASILKNYKVNSVDVVEDVKPVFEIILKPSEGIKVTLEKRDD